MPALPELQRLFWRALTGGGADPALLRAVVATPPLGAEARLDIYAGMYFTRILEALREDFPTLAALATEEGFAALVRAYLAHHPSCHPSLGRLGAALPAFLEGGGAPDLPAWAADLAHLEWLRHEVFEASDREPLALAALRAVAPEDWPALRLALVPACATLVVAWPVHALWDAPATPLAPARTALRVWREDFRVYHAPMEPAEEAALGRLAAGSSFADICEDFARGEDAAALLLRWMEDGIVAPPDDGDPSPRPHPYS